jgi:hypothetical protein
MEFVMNKKYLDVVNAARTEAKDFNEPAIVYSYKFWKFGFQQFGYCMEENFKKLPDILGFPLTRQLKIMPNGRVIQ